MVGRAMLSEQMYMDERVGVRADAGHKQSGGVEFSSKKSAGLVLAAAALLIAGCADHETPDEATVAVVQVCQDSGGTNNDCIQDVDAGHLAVFDAVQADAGTGVDADVDVGVGAFAAPTTMVSDPDNQPDSEVLSDDDSGIDLIPLSISVTGLIALFIYSCKQFSKAKAWQRQAVLDRK